MIDSLNFAGIAVIAIKGLVYVVTVIVALVGAVWTFGGKIVEFLGEHFVKKAEQALIEKSHDAVHERLSSAVLRSSDSIARVFDRLDQADKVANENQNRVSKLEGINEGRQG